MTTNTFRLARLLLHLQLLLTVNAYILTCYSPLNSPVVEKLKPELCTHLMIIGGTFVDSNGLLILPTAEELHPFVKLKRVNKDLKLFLTLTPNNRIMSQIVLSDDLMDRMANTLTHYLPLQNLDGFDIDWEFPVWSRDAKTTDKKGLSSLLKIISNQFKEQKTANLLLILTVGAPYTIARKGYDITAINKYVNYVQVMTYDFHDFSRLEPVTGFNAPLRAASYEFAILAKMNSDYSMRYWEQLGLNKTKTVFGIPTYGRGYRLLSKYLHFPYAPATGPSKYGLAVDYGTVCNLTDRGYKYYWSNSAATPYWVSGHQWIASEDQRSIREKTIYAKTMDFAGVMIFGLHADDYNGNCGRGLYPLVTAVKEELFRA